jgi:hypothetical protein
MVRLYFFLCLRLICIEKPQSPQETEHKKEGEREKEEEKILKTERKKITPRISSNKRGSQYFERRKTLQL